ncbi:MAG: hypothetical protein JRI23_17405 [Deltaproteobacteria bacterium]|jgi:hypothetical protein|nr:hypothetical protein [Deltaproteobacteria bacterium]MBW2533598.1 hypothetical protein [Deltaproteobacteria bacterium]
MDRQRRSLIGAALATLGASVAGCGSPPAVLTPPPPPERPPLVIAALTDLLPAAGLGWLVVIRPAALLTLPWLQPSLSRVLKDERLELLATTTGVDLRRVPELALGAYGEEHTVLYLVRHGRDPLAVERLFRQRLTGGEQRSVEADSRLVRVAGRIGRQSHVFVGLGREVAGFQYGGDPRRGPARVAMLYAAGKLSKSPTVSADDELGPLWKELGDAPVRTLLPGPFDETMTRGARGLLGAATAIALSATPTADRSLALAVLLGGDFTGDRERASELLLAAWGDVAESDLGHLLGIHRPVAAARAAVSPSRLRLDAAVDPAALFAGLAAATTDDIRQIMR